MIDLLQYEATEKLDVTAQPPWLVHVKDRPYSCTSIGNSREGK